MVTQNKNYILVFKIFFLCLVQYYWYFKYIDNANLFDGQPILCKWHFLLRHHSLNLGLLKKKRSELQAFYSKVQIIKANLKIVYVIYRNHLYMKQNRDKIFSLHFSFVSVFLRQCLYCKQEVTIGWRPSHLDSGYASCIPRHRLRPLGPPPTRGGWFFFKNIDII